MLKITVVVLHCLINPALDRQVKDTGDAGRHNSYLGTQDTTDESFESNDYCR